MLAYELTVQVITSGAVRPVNFSFPRFAVKTAPATIKKLCVSAVK